MALPLIPFAVPAGMMAVRLAGKWILKKLAKRSAKSKRTELKKRKREKKSEAISDQKNLDTPVSKLTKRDVKKKLKDLKKKKDTRRRKTEKELEDYHTRPSPTITKREAIARYADKKDALVQRRKIAEDILNPIANKAIAKLHKEFPQPIGGMGNAYGHGKGIGKKIERFGTAKKSREKTRQNKRENEQVAKQRRQRGEPERREVKRPKSGLHKDTPKKTEGTRQGQKIKNERLSKRKRILKTAENTKIEKQKRTRKLEEDSKRRRN